MVFLGDLDEPRAQSNRARAQLCQPLPQAQHERKNPFILHRLFLNLCLFSSSFIATKIEAMEEDLAEALKNDKVKVKAKKAKRPRGPGLSGGSRGAGEL